MADATRAVYIRLAVQDGDAAIAALRAYGVQGAQVIDKLNATAAQGSAAFKALGSSSSDASKGLGLSYQQIEQLTGSVHHFLDAVVAGQSPFRALEQQAVGLVGSFGGVALSIAKFAAPIAAIVAPIVALSVASAQYEASVRSVATAVKATGDASGLSLGQMETLAQGVSASSDISVKAVRDIEVAATNSGRLTGAVFSGVVSVANDLGKALGTTATDAAAKLTKQLQDPAKAAADLDSQLNFLSSAQLRQIDLMEQAGDKAGAQGVLVDALGTHLNGLAKGSVSGLSQAFSDLGTAASNAWDRLGGSGSTASSPEARIAQIRANVQAAAAALQAGVPNIVGKNPDGTSGIVSVASAGSDAQTQLFTAQVSLHAQQDRADQQALDQKAKSADALADSLDKVTSAQNALTGEQALYQGLIQQGVDGDGRYAQALAVVNAKQVTLLTSDKDAERQAAINAQVNAAAIGDRDLLRTKLDAQWEATKLVAAGLLDEGNKEAYVSTIVQQAAATRATAAATAVTLDDAQAASTLRIAAALGVSLAASVDARAAEEARSAKLKDSSVDEAALAAAIRQRVAADSQVSIQTTLDGLRDQATATANLTAAEGQGSAAVAEATRQNQLAAFAKKALADATAATLPLVQQEIADYDTLTKKVLANTQASAAQRELLQSSNSLEIAQAQFNLAGATDDERTREVALLQKRLELQQAGIAPESAVGQQILANVDAATQLNAAFQATQQITGDISDAITNGLEDGGKKGFAAFEDSLRRGLIALAADMLLKPLIQPVIADIVGTVTGASALASGASGASGGGSAGGLSGLLSLGSSAGSISNLGVFTGASDALDAYAGSVAPSLFGSGGIGGTALGNSIAAEGGFGAELGGGVAGSGTSAAAGSLGSASGLLGTVGAGLGTAYAGYQLGGYFASQNSGSKVPGALEGAASGAAVGATVGSIVPGIGTVAGAIVGGVAGLLGGLLGAGKSVGPNTAAGFQLNADGTYGVHEARSDNGGSDATAQTLGDSATQAINAFVASLGGKITQTNAGFAQLGTMGGHYFSTVNGTEGDFSDGGAAVQDFVVRALKDADYSGVGDDVATAIRHSAATSLDGLAADAQFGANFKNALDQYNGSADSNTTQQIASAVSAIDTTFASIEAFRQQTQALGLSVDEADAATNNYISGLLDLKQVVPDTAYQASIKTTTAEFAEMKTQMIALGDSAADAGAQVDAGLTKALDTLKTQYAASVDQQIRSAQGLSFIDDLTNEKASVDANSADIVSAGRDPAALLNAELDSTLGQLDLAQAQQALAYFQTADQTIATAVQRRIDALNNEAAATDAATAAANAATDAQNQLAAGQSIRAYLNTLAGAAGGGTPQSALNADTTQFNVDLALAKAGDADALKAITTDAQALLAAGQAVYASGADQQALVSYVEQSLSALPATVSYDQQQLATLTTIAQLQATSGDTLGSLQTMAAANAEAQLIAGSLLGVEAGTATTTGAVQAVLAEVGASNSAINAVSLGIALVNGAVGGVNGSIGSVYALIGSLATIGVNIAADVNGLGSALATIAANTNAVPSLATSIAGSMSAAAYSIVAAVNAIPPTVVNITPAAAGPDTYDYNAGNHGNALGGVIIGPGTGTSDSIPRRLSNGEFVVTAKGHRLAGTRLLQNINAGMLPSGQGGGGSGASDPATLDLLRQLVDAVHALGNVSAASGDASAKLLTDVAGKLDQLQKPFRLAATRSAA